MTGLPGSPGSRSQLGARRWPWGSGLALLALAVAVMVPTEGSHGWAVLAPPAAADIALTLWWIRRPAQPPLWSLIAFALASAALLAVRPRVGGVVALLLVCTGAALIRLPDRQALAVGAASLALALAAGVRERLQLGSINGLSTVAVTYAVGYGVMLSTRLRRRHQWETERLLADLEKEHAQLEAAHARLAEHARQVAELAASEERNRLAREIHDVLAHALTVMVVQAEAAAVRLRADPRGAAEQVRGVATLAREALQEARLSVSAMRADPGAAGIDALRRLCADAGRLGAMRCDLAVRGEERALPAPVALAAYRITQESLTNARRHGDARAVRVEVAFAPDAVTLTVDDDGRASPGADPVPGSGLRGMRERAEGVAGSLEAGRRADGAGFRVRARLPLPDRTDGAAGGPSATGPPPTAADPPSPSPEGGRP